MVVEVMAVAWAEIVVVVGDGEPGSKGEGAGGNWEGWERDRTFVMCEWMLWKLWER